MISREKTILIVDDENNLIDLLKNFLLRKGFLNILTASSGNEALEVISKNKIDIVLSDVKMPDGSGIELLGKVQAQKNNQTVFMMITGYSDITEVDLIKKGAKSVIFKPFDFNVLLDRLENIFSDSQ